MTMRTLRPAGTSALVRVVQDQEPPHFVALFPVRSLALRGQWGRGKRAKGRVHWRAEQCRRGCASPSHFLRASLLLWAWRRAPSSCAAGSGPPVKQQRSRAATCSRWGTLHVARRRISHSLSVALVGPCGDWAGRWSPPSHLALPAMTGQGRGSGCRTCRCGGTISTARPVRVHTTPLNT